MESKKTSIVLIIILLLIILGLGGYIAVDKLLLNKEDEVVSVVNVDDIDFDLNALYQINDTLSKFDAAFNDPNSSYFGYLYNAGNRLMASKFDNGAALFATIYPRLTNSSSKYVASGIVKKDFEKIFGKNLAYKPTSVNAGDKYNISYNDAMGNFTYTSPASADPYQRGYVVINRGTKLTEDSVIITRRVFYVEYQGSEGAVTSAQIYTNANKSKLIGTINLRNNVLSEDEILAKYSSKFEEYTYTFKQNNSSADYSFYSIEKTR